MYDFMGPPNPEGYVSVELFCWSLLTFGNNSSVTDGIAVRLS